MNANVKFVAVDDSSFETAVLHLNSIQDVLGFDTETDRDGSLKFIQFYSPLSNQSFIFDPNSPKIDFLLERWSNWNVVGHNIQFDLSACLRQFGSYPKPVADTFLLACSLQEEQKGLKPLCNAYFGFPIKSWEELFGDYDYNMNDDKWQYVANDPYYTYILLEHYQLNGAYSFVKEAHNIDIKAMIHYMEGSTLGLQIDIEKFNNYLTQYTDQVSSLQDKLNLYAGWEVRTTSTKDLKTLLFEQMGLPIPPITTGKGEVSVSKEALSYVPDQDGIISLITEIKESRSVLSAMKNLV